MLKSGDDIAATAESVPVLLHGENLESWKREIGALRNAVDLWRAMLKGRQELVSAFKKQLGDPDKLPMKVSHMLHLDDRDPAMAALSVVQRSASSVLKSGLEVDFLFTRNEPRLQLSLKPHSLRGAIWLQFAAAVEERRNLEKYKNCGRPFEISRAAPTGKRSDAKFCSTGCRVEGYHVRIEQARRLAKSGVPLAEIAREVGSDAATVRRWVELSLKPISRPVRRIAAKCDAGRRHSPAAAKSPQIRGARRKQRSMRSSFRSASLLRERTARKADARAPTQSFTAILCKFPVPSISSLFRETC